MTHRKSASRNATNHFKGGILTLLGLVVALSLVASASAGTGTRSDPFKYGALVKMNDGFWIRVASVDRSAWPQIKSQSRSNRPPRAGDTYVMVTIRATNHGKAQGIPFVNGVLDALGRSKARYSPYAQGCGVVPDDFLSVDAVGPGGSLVARACWEVSKSDLGSLLMVYRPYRGGRETFFALR